jgi:hypothetical protein
LSSARGWLGCYSAASELDLRPARSRAGARAATTCFRPPVPARARRGNQPDDQPFVPGSAVDGSSGRGGRRPVNWRSGASPTETLVGLLGGRRCERKPDLEAGRALIARHRDLSTRSRHNRADDRQAETRMRATTVRVLGGCDAIEALEQVGQVLGRNRDAAVGDRGDGEAIIRPRRQLDATVGRSVPERVVNEVHDGLRQPIGICPNGQHPVSMRLDVTPRSHHPRCLSHSLYELAEIDVPPLDLTTAGLKVGEQK